MRQSQKIFLERTCTILLKRIPISRKRSRTVSLEIHEGFSFSFSIGVILQNFMAQIFSAQGTV